jgi:hypothetical protein
MIRINCKAEEEIQEINATFKSILKRLDESEDVHISPSRRP